MPLHWKKNRVWQGGATILLMPTLMAIFSLGLWNWSRQQERDAADWVIHTQRVLKTSDQLLISLVDAETGVRGYALTVEPVFLEPYRNSQSRAVSIFQALEQLTQDNSAQQDALETIATSLEDYFNLLEQINQSVAIAQQQGLTPTPSSLLVNLRDNKTKLDALRLDIDEVKEREERLLANRQTRLRRTQQRVDGLLFLTILLSIGSYGLALYLFWKVDQAIAARTHALMCASESLHHTNKALEQRNRDLDDFAYIVSHDLKAPLRGVARLSAWLIEDLQLPDDSESNHLVELLHEQVDKMRSMIDGLLAYSRAGREPISVTVVDIRQLIQDIASNLDIPETFNIQVDSELSEIQTEELLLSRVLSNLIDNSYRYCNHSDGKVKISVQRNAAGYYDFAVADDGPGIASQYQDRVFKIFQTGSVTNADSSGIGLASVKKIIVSRGGKIHLSSELDQGTTFYFSWPYSH